MQPIGNPRVRLQASRISSKFQAKSSDMREFIKGLIILGLLTSAIAAAMAWIEDRPGEVAWMLRIGGPAVALGCFVLLVFLLTPPSPSRTMAMVSAVSSICPNSTG